MNVNLNRLRESIFAGLILAILLMAACKESPRPATATSHIRLDNETLIDYNRSVVRTEEQEIANFLTRYGWDMKQTSTGLRYLIYRNGIGRKSSTGMMVRFRYTVKLLNGTIIYSSDSLGEKTFILGHGGVETGLEEGMLLLREGDRAKFIIPSYLAFGLLGDQDKVPPAASLVYDVDIIEFKTTK